MFELIKELKIYIIAFVVGFVVPPALIVLIIEGNTIACSMKHCFIPYTG